MRDELLEHVKWIRNYIYRIDVEHNVSSYVLMLNLDAQLNILASSLLATSIEEDNSGSD